MPKRKTTAEFVQQAKEIHGDKYDYSLVDYKNNKTKVKIICPIHGIFEQRPDHFFQGCACPECSNLKLRNERLSSLENFINNAIKIHGSKYDYSLVKYNGMRTKVKIICPIHGIFEQTPDLHIFGKRGCRSCHESHGEKAIRVFLEKNGLKQNVDFFREYKFENLKDKHCLRYDFFIPSKNLLIEYNGEQHYRFKNGFKDTHDIFLLRKHHDWLKRKYARDNNIKLLTIPYWDFKIIDELLKESLA